MMQLLVAYHAVYRALNKSDDPYPVLPGEVGDYRGWVGWFMDARGGPASRTRRSGRAG